MMKYKIVYSKRRTVGITVKMGEVIVRAPESVSEKAIEIIVAKHEKWIINALEREKILRESRPALSDEQISELKKSAKEYFDVICSHYASIMKLSYKKLTITCAQKRFGSCSSNKTICFSYRLMLYPEKAREYVAVHELAHLVHMNHSKKFYDLIASVLPDWKERLNLLKNN